MLTASAALLSAWRTFPNTNAVDGCGLTCTNSTPFTCLGVLPSAAACASLCASLPSSACPLWTYSSTTRNCWTRSDALWQPLAHTGVTAGCNDTLVPGCAPPAPPHADNLTVTIGASPISTTHPLHPAVALDFWRHDDPVYGEKWGNSSALTIDLASPALRAAAASLSPALLRLGGSPEDSLVFDANGTCVPKSGGGGPFAPYFCSQVHPYTYDCLTRARWSELLSFASATGLRIALGLNGCIGRAAADKPMDRSNARALFAATAAARGVSGALWGFELSNEVVPQTISADAWVADVAALKVDAEAAFSAQGLPPPPFVGPDQSWGGLEGVAAASPPSLLAAMTYHEYPQCTYSATAGLVLSPACLYKIDSDAASAMAAAAHSPPPLPQVWMGEGADHSGGGVAGLTDTFVSSFYTAWLYGSTAANGVTLTARQCLSGGDYELLQRVNFAPNPDFWIVWLFKQMCGGGVGVRSVAASANATATGVRVFAFEAGKGTGGALVLLAINLQLGNGVAIHIEGSGAGLSRTELHLTSANITEPHGGVLCNGVPLKMNPATHAPPDWRGLGVPAAAGSSLVLAPASIAFVLLQ